MAEYDRLNYAQPIILYLLHSISRQQQQAKKNTEKEAARNLLSMLKTAVTSLAD